MNAQLSEDGFWESPLADDAFITKQGQTRTLRPDLPDKAEAAAYAYELQVHPIRLRPAFPPSSIPQ